MTLKLTARDFMQTGTLRQVVEEDTMLYYAEGLDGTVVVTQTDHQIMLLINGKSDASSVGDLTTQVSLGQFGALMHPNPKNALIIGLGSGITASSLATHDSLEDITLLEISPEVIEASDYFIRENQNVLADPRLNVVSADARNYVLAADKQWDLIVSEPSNPWISGVSNLFTRDFMELIKQKLAPGGIMTQWFHMYSLSESDVRSVIRSFSDTYAHVSIWHLQRGDLIMIGSDQPHTLDFQRLQSALIDERTGPDLARAGFHTPRDLLRHYLIGNDVLIAYAASGKLNTDNNPLIEFNAPRSMYATRSTINLMDIVKSVDGQRLLLPLDNQLRQEGSLLDASAMGILVSGLPESSVGMVRSGWMVWRQLFENEGNRKIGVADQREMLWEENGGTVHVALLHHDIDPDAEIRHQTLTQSIQVPIVNGGRLQHPIDENARWLLGAVPDSDQIELALLWTCPQTGGGVNRYLVVSKQTASAQLSHAELAESFSARFVCQ